MQITQKGSTITGSVDVTGETCVRQGTVNGTVAKGNVEFGWVSDAASDVHFEGTVTGSTMSGTYSAIACGTTDFIVTGTWQAQKQK
jgi:hypothetical protein